MALMAYKESRRILDFEIFVEECLINNFTIA